MKKQKQIKREPKDPKVPLPLKVPLSLFNELDQEAKEKGISRSNVALDRLKHYPVPLTPALMYELENAKTCVYNNQLFNWYIFSFGYYG